MEITKNKIKLNDKETVFVECYTDLMNTLISQTIDKLRNDNLSIEDLEVVK